MIPEFRCFLVLSTLDMMTSAHREICSSALRAGVAWHSHGAAEKGQTVAAGHPFSHQSSQHLGRKASRKRQAGATKTSLLLVL